MICSNCGSHIHEGDRFCNICGAFIAAPTNNGFPAAGNIAPNYSTEQPQSAPKSSSAPAPTVFTAQQPTVYPATAPQSAYYENTVMSPTPMVFQGVPAKKKRKTWMLFIIFSVTALLLAISLILILKPKPYESPVKTYYEGLCQGNYGKMYSVTTPQEKEAVDAIYNQYGFDKRSFMDYYDDYYALLAKYVSIDYSIGKYTKCSSEEIDSLKKDFYELFEIDLPCDKAYNVTVTGSLRYKGIRKTFEVNCHVVQVDGKWHLCNATQQISDIAYDWMNETEDLYNALITDHPEFVELYEHLWA